MSVSASSTDIEKIRQQFPVLHQKVNGKDLVYFDNAATTQKPREVIDAIVHYYQNINSNIHRGVHSLAEEATNKFEETRSKIAEFIGASESQEIIFTKGTTESINLVAASLSQGFVKKGQHILISALEHHSNIVPWQLLCEKTGAELKIIPITKDGKIDLDAYRELLSEKTALVAVNHVSNALGTINPVNKICSWAKDFNALVLIDGAQAASHIDLNVQEINCDFYACSAHKMYGPTGVGCLYGKREILEELPPYQLGGEMIKNVSFEKTTYNDIPYKFEAGTPNIADVIAWRAAIDFVNKTGKENIRKQEFELTQYANQQWSELEGIRLYGPEDRISVVSFTFEDIHSFDIGQMLDARGIAVRTGHHCTEPLMQILGVDGTVRASFAVYNTKAEIDQMTEGLNRIVSFFSKK